MPCPSVLQLRRFLNDELDSAERAALLSHTSECAVCQRELESQTTAATFVLNSHSELSSSAPGSESGLSELIRRLREQPLPDWSGDSNRDCDQSSVQFAGPISDVAPLGWLDGYQVQVELGSGTNGQVFAARDSRLGRRVALKVLRPQLAGHAAARLRFEREARAVAALEDEHVVRIFEVATSANFAPYMVMEFVNGESLDARLDRDRTLPARDAAEIARQVALGLSAAHRQGIVHRDVKPSNVLLAAGDSRSGGHVASARDNSPRISVKLADFGLARVAESNEQLTQDGLIAGTPAYMSPEQIRRPQEADARSDVYSVGVLLYEMLTGERPFRGVLRMVLNQALNDEPVPPRRLNDHVPRDLETICLKAMSKEPARRYSIAAELADDLQRWLDGQPVLARPIGSLSRAWRWCRRNPKLAMLNAVVVTVLLAGAFDAARYALPANQYRQDLDAARAEAYRWRNEAEWNRAERRRMAAAIVDGAPLEAANLSQSTRPERELLEAALKRIDSIPAPDSQLLRQALALAGRLANDLIERKEFVAAEPVLEQATLWNDWLLESANPVVTDRQTAVLLQRNRALVELRLGRRADAELRLKQLERMLEDLELDQQATSAQPGWNEWIAAQRRELAALRSSL